MVPSQVGAGSSIGGGLGGSRESRLRVQRDRLAHLKDSMQRVADKLRSPEGSTKAQRTALRAQFNDLQREVNELDGIVAGEGQEAQAKGEVSGAPVRPHRGGGEPSRPASVTGSAGASGGASAAAPDAAGVDVVA